MESKAIALSKNIYTFLGISTVIIIYKNFRLFLKLLAGESGLSWDEIAVIPGIKFFRGELLGDFYSNSMDGSPYYNVAKLLSYILPQKNIEMLGSFAVINCIAESLTACLSILLISLSITFLLKNNKKQFYSFSLGKNVLYLVTIFYFIENVDFIKDYINPLMAGANVMGWGLILGNGLYPNGVSFLLSLLVLVLLLLIDCSWIYIKDNFLNIYRFVIYLLYSFSIYIHPVVPLYTIFTLFFLNLFIPKGLNNLINFKLVFKLLLIWTLGAFLFNYIYISKHCL